MAINASGDVVACWKQNDGYRNLVYANTYTPGSGWGTEEVIQSSVWTAGESSVAIDSSGKAIAVWAQSDSSSGTRFNIMTNVYDPVVGWGIDEPIEFQDLGTAREPTIQIDSSGNAIVVWKQHDGVRNSVMSNVYNSITGSWGTEELLEPYTGATLTPSLSVASSGEAIAIWSQTDGNQYSILANIYK